MILPSTSPITLAFGATTDPYSAASPHMGTDFAHIPDNKIYAPFAGKVKLVPNNGKDGNGIYMMNGNQLHGLLHTSQYLVTDGADVKEGQTIGIMGDTGFAQGVHLHWAVKVNGQFIDPLILLDPAYLTKGEVTDMVDTDEKARALFLAILHQPEVTDEAIKSIKWQPYDVVIQALQAYDKWHAQNDQLVAFPKLQEAIQSLEAPEGDALLGAKFKELITLVNQEK